MNPPEAHISVCVCTYKRPELLGKLLRELEHQETNGRFTYSVVIADNDAKESARGAVEQFARGSRLGITYCVEPEQNIALARNRVIQNAKGDWLAFIDDDEFPCKDWLLRLFEACHKYQVSGVLGPVLPFFEQEPPRWIIKGRFYDRPTHDTGFMIDWNEGRTGNVLLRRSVLDGIEGPFRPEFGSGGEDRDLFKRLFATGHRFVWCNEAAAYEVVPQVRWKRSFMLRRALLRGKVSLTNRASAPVELSKSLLAIPAYTVALPFLLALGQHAFMRYLIRLCDHLGRVLAFVGINPVKEKYVIE
ncbi:MAG TPA: glycosyltransferase family A protein [Verrucomicrobiae bacterium]|nr:glycosyltransferase family A protein [Verrucomicrobiae bacterium]